VKATKWNRTTQTNRISAHQLQQEILDGIAGIDAEFGISIRYGDQPEMHVGINADELFPLASLVKVPILIEALAQVDVGRQSLTEQISIEQEHKLLPFGVLLDLNPGLELTFSDLLTLMIVISDNTATDRVLDLIGIEYVNQHMQESGIQPMSVKLSIKQLLEASFGCPPVDLPPYEIDRWILANESTQWNDLATRRSLENNVASPRAMTTLFDQLARGDLLTPASTAYAIDRLLRQHYNDRESRATSHQPLRSPTRRDRC
jgi:beta-lactamase class A